MILTSILDPLFRDAVAAIDAGDLPGLERLLAAHPALVVERLDDPGAWLRAQVGDALDGFFQRPYLLWFVAEDPVRNGRLPGNIAQAAARSSARHGVNRSQACRNSLTTRFGSWPGPGSRGSAACRSR